MGLFTKTSLFILCAASAAATPSTRLSAEAITGVEVSSTSAFREGKRAVFKPEHLTDRRDWSAWGSVAQERAGAWITLKFDQVHYLSGLQFVPGNARDRDTFSQCARPAKLTLVTEQGRRTLIFKDRRYHQAAEIEPPLAGRALKILIEETHGNRGQAGVCLSEIYLDTLADPLASLPDLAAQIREAVAALDGPRWRRGQASLLKIGAPAAAPLIQALASPARMSRAAAILADLGAAQAIKPLAAYARHPDPNARRAALSALGRLGSQVHFKPIQAWYEAALDPEEQARAFAALIGTGHPGALDALLEALGGGDAQRRDLALTGLARFKGVTARISRQLRAEGLKARVAATLALAVVDVEEVEARLRAALAAPSVELRAAAIIALAHRRLNYAEISRGWADEHAEIRAATAYALGRFKAEADLETLETLTGDVSMRVRAAAAAAMSAYGARAASKLRRLALSGPDGATALAAAQGHLRGATGAELGQRAAVLLGSHHEEVQALAGRTISRGDEAQARLLATVLGDDPRAQAAATPLLVKLGPEITPGVLARFKGATADQQIALLRVLKGLGDPSVAPFIADLFEQAPPATVRREIVTLLGDCHDRALASATLKEALLDADLSVQIAAITALGQIRDKSAAPELIVMLSTAPKQAHRAIVRALGQIRQRDAISTLASHYRTRKHDVNASELRADLIVAIGQIGGRSSLPVLFDAMDDMDARVRQAAARALE